MRGERPAARHQRPGQPASASTRCPTRTTRTGTARRSRTTARRSSSPTSGAAVRRRAAASPTSSAGARTRSTTSSTRSSCSAATTSCRSRRRTRRTASPICPRCPGPRPRHHGAGLVPGRRLAVDFTDSSHPQEIGYYDRGPISGDRRSSSAASGRRTTSTGRCTAPRSPAASTPGLTPNDELSANEIDAAAEVEIERLTPQHQPQITSPAELRRVRSYLDQLVRAGTIEEDPEASEVHRRAERLGGPQQPAAAATCAPSRSSSRATSTRPCARRLPRSRTRNRSGRGVLDAPPRSGTRLPTFLETGAVFIGSMSTACRRRQERSR